MYKCGEKPGSGRYVCIKCSEDLFLDDETDTLLKYDIINMLGNVNKELVDQISKEGICIYEKVQ